MLADEGISEFLREGGVAALSLYEWFDGSGVPRGLKGDEIARSARIIAVADAFDAMFTCGGKPSVPDFDAALDAIRGRSGTQFDPALVAVFMRYADEARRVYMEGGQPTGQFFY